MLENIYLKNVYTEKDMGEIWNLMEKEEGIRSIFHGKQDRISSSVAACLIKKEDKTIGFFALTVENLDDVLFLDIGLKKKYRGQGIGKMICEEIISQKPLNKFIIAETKNDNIGANSAFKFQSSLVYNTNNLNYYLLDKNREQEFLESPIYEQFIKYCNSEKPKQYQFVRNLRDNK